MTAIGVAGSHFLIPRLAIASPILLAFAVFGDLATMAICLRREPLTRALVALALSYGVSGVLTALLTLLLPLTSDPPVFPSGIQTSIWFYIAWHFFAASGAFVYLFFRLPAQSSRPASRGFFACGIVVATLAIAAGCTVAFLLADDLPRIMIGGAPLGLLRTGVGPAIAALSFMATISLLRSPDGRPLQRAYAIAMLLLTAELMTAVFGVQRYTLGFFFGRTLIAAASALVLGSAIQSLLESGGLLAKSESSLSVSLSESAKRAARIRALREISSVDEGDESARFYRMLEIATTAMRPQRPMIGTLSHLDDAHIVYDAIVWTGDGEPNLAVRLVTRGTIVPLKRTLQGLVAAAGTTCAWDDIVGAGITDTIANDIGLFGAIGAPVQIGSRTHFLVFSALQRLEAPFAEDDVAYVEVVASLFANTFNQIASVERLRHHMEHDQLTGLENRSQFRNAIRRSIYAGRPFAVAIMNVDGFRQFNDVHGQMIADGVLVEMAARLDEASSSDMVARLNGDEFGILTAAGDPDPSNGSDTLGRYSQLFLRPFHTGDRGGTHTLSLCASFGVARYPEHGTTAEELLRSAGVALDIAKERGGGTTVVFEPAMERIREERRVAAADIAKAIENDEFRLVYQPTFDLRTREFVGAEALIRWTHPQRGELSPVEFIPVAERNGLIGSISRWVLARLVKDLLSTDRLPPQLRFYFNLSVQDLEDFALIDAMDDALTKHPHLARILGVEITESAAMKNVEQALNTLGLFRKMGIHVAIDDFGTGYSSLSYLKRLAVDVIKIDRSFVMGLPEDDKDASLAETMIGICSRFNLRSLAEGIETEDQCAWLLTHGCQLGQGYLVAKPLTFAQFLERAQPAARERTMA